MFFDQVVRRVARWLGHRRSTTELASESRRWATRRRPDPQTPRPAGSYAEYVALWPAENEEETNGIWVFAHDHRTTTVSRPFTIRRRQ